MADLFNVQPGTVFAGDYRIVRAMSAGGMGAVYVAEQISTGKQRAMKVMLPQLVADPALRKRFEQEARIGSLIESEHVVEVVGAGVDAASGLPWLAMELLQGEELAELVAKRGPLPVPEVLQIFEQLCHAVGAAHRVGVVHRDLKPENIFLAQARRAGATFMVKVLDFGIAKIVAESSTKQTAAMGSPIWMAPEQADQSPITPATDVWALGLIAFFLLTGRAFWKCANDDSATIPQILKEVLFEPIIPASRRTAELGCSLPPAFDAWFAHCVARDPAGRFPDAAQAGLALSAALGGLAGSPLADLAFAATAGAPPPQAGTGTGPLSFAGTSPAVGAWTGPARSTGPQPGQPGVAAVITNSGGGTSGPLAPGGGQPGFAAAPPRPKVPGAVAAAIVLVAIVLGGFVAGGVWWASRRSTTATATAVASADMATVLDAKRLCDTGKCDTAHQHLAQLAPTSDARLSSEFKDVEFKWATETMLLADRSPDVGTKRSLLDSVAQSQSVDETVRASARDRLLALDSAPTSGADAASVALPGSRRVGVSVPRAPTTTATSAPQAIDTAPTATAQPPPPPPAQPVQPTTTKSIYDLATSSSRADWWTARRALEAKIPAGTATPEEIRLLSQVCKNQGDSDCLKRCNRILRAKR